jgi:hypothetical protein
LGRLPDTNSASNPAPAKKTNPTQQLVTAAPSVAKPSKGPTAPLAKKMSMPVTAVAKSAPTSVASASVPSSRKSERLLGKGKKREGDSENNAIKIEDSSSSDDESVDSDSTEEAGEVHLGHNPELPKYNASSAKANAAEVNARKHESIGMRTSSGKGRGRKVLMDAENKLLLVYPFKGADEEMLVEASMGLKELSGHRLGEKDEMDVEEVEATTIDSSHQNDDEATVEVKGSVRAHCVTILQEDYICLVPGQLLNDSLVDFWMRWYDHCSRVALPPMTLRHQLTFPPPIFHPHYRRFRHGSWDRECQSRQVVGGS